MGTGWECRGGILLPLYAIGKDDEAVDFVIEFPDSVETKDMLTYQVVKVVNQVKEREDRKVYREFRELKPEDGKVYSAKWKDDGETFSTRWKQDMNSWTCRQLESRVLKEGTLPERVLVSYFGS